MSLEPSRLVLLLYSGTKRVSIPSILNCIYLGVQQLQKQRAQDNETF